MTEVITLDSLVNDELEVTEEDIFNIGPGYAEFFIDHPEKMLVSTEAVFNNKDDKEAPDTTKCRITVLGLGFKAKFTGGEEVPADADAIFGSNHMKAKLKEFDDYYIGKLGYRPFTKQDEYKFHSDTAQILRKIYQFNLFNKVGFNYIDGHGLWGLWKWGLGKIADSIRGKDDTQHGIDNALVSSVVNGLVQAGFALLQKAGVPAQPGSVISSILTSRTNNSILSAPFCIAYIKPQENGPDKVFIRRILVIGFWTKNISKLQAKWGSGGKDIGTV
jgi:hypothetical protein